MTKKRRQTKAMLSCANTYHRGPSNVKLCQQNPNNECTQSTSMLVAKKLKISTQKLQITSSATTCLKQGESLFSKQHFSSKKPFTCLAYFDPLRKS